jgi:hypothetical protein
MVLVLGPEAALGRSTYEPKTEKEFLKAQNEKI